MTTAQDIKQAITRALASVGIEAALDEIVLEHPAELTHGDYATSVALKYAKQVGKSPRGLAEEIVEALGEVEGVSKIDIAGPGFINFTLAPQAIAASLDEARTEDMWGANNLQKGKKIMVEYTDPNPFKEFHIGHLMSNGTGEAISRLLQFSGADIKRANWQGDVGPHVAKAIWGKMHKPELKWGEAYTYGSNEYEAHKDEVDAINKKVYDKGDESINALYTQGRAESLAHFEKIYKILGTKFDYYFFEGTEGLAGIALVKDAQAKGIFVESDGAVVFAGEQYGLHTRVFLTSQGLPTYEAKELGLNQAKFEKEPSLDRSIIITANEQIDYFKVVLKAMEFVLPAVATKTVHISHGMMRFAEGKMSSRTGNVITGESLLSDLAEAAKERAAESRADDHDLLAQQIAVAAIKYQILKQGSGKDIIFDRERALSLEGDSGPYLQYAYARTNAIIAKAQEQGVAPALDRVAAPSEVTRILHRFPEIVQMASQALEPHMITQYLLSVASAFNSWYAQEQILDGTPAAAHKVAVTEAVNRTLKNGLWILGIPAPDKM
jgi:arginyl-tRNA synthetase